MTRCQKLKPNTTRIKRGCVIIVRMWGNARRVNSINMYFLLEI
jgi:hypothetical protein